MLFNSFEFAIFFILVSFLYYRIEHSHQNWLLLVGSYFFYGWWDWRFLSLLAISTGIDFFCGLWINQSSDPKKRHFYLMVSIVSNLGMLGFFKYFHFFIDSVQAGAQILFGWTLDTPTLQILLPVGISFYTFQTLSYVIDVYRGDIPACKSFRDFALFVSFFPQLVAGPIERAQDLLPQITQPRKTSATQWIEGGWLIYWGLFKKIFVADNMAVYVDTVFNPYATPTGAEIWLGTYAFAIQIYGDFSGYSDMARGLAKWLGFELSINFSHPYLAKNPQEFWRGWHITLSTWLRDYLYIPLGGNRQGQSRLFFALLMTMFLGGLWHGARWNFLIWGLYHGLLLIGFRFISPRIPNPQNRIWRNLFLGIQILFFFHLTCFGWLIFRAEGAFHLGRLLNWFYEGFYFSSISENFYLLGYMLILGIYQLVSSWKQNELWILQAPLFLRVLLYLVLYYCMAVYSIYGNQPFIYFQF